MRKYKIAGIQVGAYAGNYEKNWTKIYQTTEEVILKERPEVVAYSELMHVPYFASLKDDHFFSFAEEMKGHTVRKVSDIAVTFGVYIVGTLFEKEVTSQDVNYFNTAFICSPISGVIGKYRKVHLPCVNNTSLTTNEKYYFEKHGGGGKEFPVFTLDNGLKVGILICFDRSFPEAWRALSIQGVDLIIVPTATYGFRKDLFIQELQVRAMENNVFVLCVNKAGKEKLKGETKERHHFGSSCMINPFGEIIQFSNDEEWSSVVGVIDLKENNISRQRVDWNKERKPGVYHPYLHP